MKLLTPEIKEALRLFPLHSTENVRTSQKVFICKLESLTLPLGLGIQRDIFFSNEPAAMYESM